MFLLDFAPELHYLTNYGMFRVGFTMPMITSSVGSASALVKKLAISG